MPRQETADYALIETVVGLAVFAKRALPAHSVLSAVAFGPSRTEPWRHSLQIGADEHAEPQPTFLRYLSHSCDPNLFIDLRARQVITLRPISPGDELTIFYPATEWRMQSPFACACGAARCLGEIRGAADLPPAVLKRYRLSHVIAAPTGAQAELG